MSNRCTSCGKMAALEFQDPEIDDFDGSVERPEKGETAYTVSASCTVRLVRNTECCGEELKTADLEITTDDETFEIAEGTHTDDKCKEDFTVEVDGDPEQVEEGGGRYKKSYFGASFEVVVTCGCGETVHSFTMTDKVAASEMDEA